MFRLWVREFKETHMIKDIVIEDDSDDTRAHKIMNALEKACTAFDLAVPIWLDNNISDFKRTDYGNSLRTNSESSTIVI